jgi:hypothetical protein
MSYIRANQPSENMVCQRRKSTESTQVRDKLAANYTGLFHTFSRFPGRHKMLVRRLNTGLFMMAILGTGSTSWAFPWKFWQSKPKIQKTQPAKVKPAVGTDHLHTQAQFVYAGQPLQPVSGTEALLYDASDPQNRDVVEAIHRLGQGAAPSADLCGARVTGRAQTVGPQGDIYFDFVDRGSYWIIVCKQVKFDSVANPVWVAGAAEISASEFTDATEWDFELPRQIQINLDTYASELKAKPIDMAYVAPEPDDVHFKMPNPPPTPASTEKTMNGTFTVPTADALPAPPDKPVNSEFTAPKVAPTPVVAPKP